MDEVIALTNRWSKYIKIESKLNVLQNKFLRNILSIYKKEMLTNVEIIERANEPCMSESETKQQWGYIDHELRMQVSGIQRQTLHGK